MAALEDVERLFFQYDLLVLRKILGELRAGFIRYCDEFVRQGFGHQFRARRPADAVWRKLRELRIVCFVDAAVGNKKDAAFTCRNREAAEIWQKFLGAGNVEFPARLHEIFLGINLPEDHVLRDRLIFHPSNFSTWPVSARELAPVSH